MHAASAGPGGRTGYSYLNMEPNVKTKADIVDRLRWDMRYTRGHVPVTLSNAADEIERLRADLSEAEDLLQIAYYGHQKMGLEGRGADGLPHETRMFAQAFSDAETPKTPQHTMLKGTGRYWRFWTRNMKSAAVEQNT